MDELHPFLWNFPSTGTSPKCADGHLHAGGTSGPGAAHGKHAKGQVHYTSSRLPVACIAAFGVVDRYIAYKFDK